MMKSGNGNPGDGSHTKWPAAAYECSAAHVPTLPSAFREMGILPSACAAKPQIQ
jgi:hypothetical protein